MNEYTEFVKALAKPGKDIAGQMTPIDAHMLHMVLGISGEAGELLDAIKKSVIYQKDLDIANVIEELGDIEFYLEGLRSSIGITREECIAANMKKLSARYKEIKYSDKAAQERAGKEPPIAHGVNGN